MFFNSLFHFKWTPKCIVFVFFKIPEIPFVREWLMAVRGKRSCFLWKLSGTLNAHNFFFCTKYLHIFMHSIFFSGNRMIMLAKCWYRILLGSIQNIFFHPLRKTLKIIYPLWFQNKREKIVKIKTAREP